MKMYKHIYTAAITVNGDPAVEAYHYAATVTDPLLGMDHTIHCRFPELDLLDLAQCAALANGTREIQLHNRQADGSWTASLFRGTVSLGDLLLDHGYAREKQTQPDSESPLVPVDNAMPHYCASCESYTAEIYRQDNHLIALCATCNRRGIVETFHGEHARTKVAS